MIQENFSKVLQTTKEANAILGEAGGAILKASFNTAKQIATLYKDAGLKAFSLSKELVKKTVELSLENQKSALRTSGNAIKAAAKTIRDKEPALKTMTKATVKKAGKNTKRKKKEITIDDLIE